MIDEAVMKKMMDETDCDAAVAELKALLQGGAFQGGHGRTARDSGLALAARSHEGHGYGGRSKMNTTCLFMLLKSLVSVSRLKDSSFRSRLEEQCISLYLGLMKEAACRTSRK